MVIASIQELTNSHTKGIFQRRSPLLQAGSKLTLRREGTRLSGVRIGNAGTVGDTLAVYCWASSSALAQKNLVPPIQRLWEELSPNARNFDTIIRTVVLVLLITSKPRSRRPVASDAARRPNRSLSATDASFWSRRHH
jgi:hypothetical protein